MARFLKMTAILVLAGAMLGACAGGKDATTRDRTTDVKVRWSVGLFR